MLTEDFPWSETAEPPELWREPLSAALDAPEEPDAQVLARLPLTWIVAQTKTRHEKSLARSLARAEQPYFLPLVKHYSINRHCRLVPLFPGIVFVPSFDTSCAPPAMDRLSFPQAHEICYQSGYVFGFLHCKNQPRLRKELSFLASESQSDRTMRFEAMPRKGQLVEVRAGPMQGLRGKVDRAEPGIIYIELSFMQQAILMEIDPAMVEAY